MLQEALKPKIKLPWSTPAENDIWQIQGYKVKFCTAVVGLTKRIKGHPLPLRRIGDSGENSLAVSLPGTIASAEIKLVNGESVIVASVYATWGYSFPQKRPIFADASAHRIISDISALISSPAGKQLIISGDWNIFYGYGDEGRDNWKARYHTVFARMEALGLLFVGPQYPNGIRARQSPAYFPPDSKNVPTYRKKRVGDDVSATDQLDFVFASSCLYRRLHVKALNTPEIWGPSDHCRIMIELL